MNFKQRLKSLNSDQKDMFDIMTKEDLYQFRVPTGVGKGYVMIMDIYNKIINSDQNIFCIASHRLSLNTQHLKDVLERMVEFDLIGDIGFISVGSDALNFNKFVHKLSDTDRKKFNNGLRKNNLSKDDIFTKTLRTDEVSFVANKHLKENRKVIIISTYHSLHKVHELDINNLYLDEAHTLANDKEEETEFRRNFEKINAKKSFFFSATPKDLSDKEDIKNHFLMNNDKVFGKAYELSFKHCVEQGYIVRPLVHIALPDDGIEKNFDSDDNKLKFILDTFEAHRKWLQDTSSFPDEINPKILVRCESVPQMWILKKMLTEVVGDKVIIGAGASYNTDGIGNHEYDNKRLQNREDFLNLLSNTPYDKDMIILHYDVLSEGINVAGFTGVLFLQNTLPTITKTLQNVGRSTRLHPKDRKNLLSNNIKIDSKKGWVKPYCAVILPYWNNETQENVDILSWRIKNMRDNYSFQPTFIISTGSDIAGGVFKNELLGENSVKEFNKNYDIIKKIISKIEQLEKNDDICNELDLINNLSIQEYLNYIKNGHS